MGSSRKPELPINESFLQVQKIEGKSEKPDDRFFKRRLLEKVNSRNLQQTAQKIPLSVSLVDQIPRRDIRGKRGTEIVHPRELESIKTIKASKKSVKEDRIPSPHRVYGNES